MGFGSKLAKFRKERNIRQDHFAERLGLNRSYLNQVEREKENPPRLETILFMIGLLQLSPEEAFDLILEAKRVQNPGIALTVAEIERLGKSLEAFEAAARGVQPLQIKLQNALKAAEQKLLTDLTI